MNALHKKIVAAVIIVCAVVLFGAVLWNSKKQDKTEGAEVSTEAFAEQENQRAEDNSAYQQAKTDLIFWYQSESYTAFFEKAVQQYFEKTGIKVSAAYQDTIDYIGDIYDKTMQDGGFPDIYLISGDNLEENYLYGLVSANESQDKYAPAAENAVKASSYQDKMLGYPLSYNTCVFVYQTGYFETEPESLQAIIDFSDQNDPPENVEYLLEWDINDAFYDFPFISNSVTFDKAESEKLNIIYDEELYQQDLEYFETILNSFSVDAENVSEDSIIENFLAGRTLSAIIDTDSLSRLEGYSYSLMGIPDLNENLTAAPCATTDMLVVNDYTEKGELAEDFAEYVTIEMAGELHDLTGHYSVFPSKEPEWTEQVAYDAYQSAVLVPNSQDAKDFWVALKETISKYF